MVATTRSPAWAASAGVAARAFSPSSVTRSASVAGPRERSTLAAASNSGALTADIAAPLLDSLTELTGRAQQAGLIRADLTPEDIHRILGMLTNVLWGMEPGSDGWRRYVVLVLDALSPDGASPLPPAQPIEQAPRADTCRPI
jgi:hypothetical protein